MNDNNIELTDEEMARLEYEDELYEALEVYNEFGKNYNNEEEPVEDEVHLYNNDGSI